MLMATCPRCRNEVDTGVAADEGTMRELGPRLRVVVLCDSCHEYQRMLVKDLYFAVDSPELAA